MVVVADHLAYVAMGVIVVVTVSLLAGAVAMGLLDIYRAVGWRGPLAVLVFLSVCHQVGRYLLGDF